MVESAEAAAALDFREHEFFSCPARGRRRHDFAQLRRRCECLEHQRHDRLAAKRCARDRCRRPRRFLRRTSCSPRASQAVNWQVTSRVSGLLRAQIAQDGRLIGGGLRASAGPGRDQQFERRRLAHFARRHSAASRIQSEPAGAFVRSDHISGRREPHWPAGHGGSARRISSRLGRFRSSRDRRNSAPAGRTIPRWCSIKSRCAEPGILSRRGSRSRTA